MMRLFSYTYTYAYIYYIAKGVPITYNFRSVIKYLERWMGNYPETPGV